MSQNRSEICDNLEMPIESLPTANREVINARRRQRRHQAELRNANPDRPLICQMNCQIAHKCNLIYGVPIDPFAQPPPSYTVKESEYDEEFPALGAKIEKSPPKPHPMENNLTVIDDDEDHYVEESFAEMMSAIRKIYKAKNEKLRRDNYIRHLAASHISGLATPQTEYLDMRDLLNNCAKYQSN